MTMNLVDRIELIEWIYQFCLFYCYCVCLL